MIKELSNSKDSVLGFEISGKVTEDEEKEWLLKIENMIEEHGKISVLLVLSKNTSWGSKAGFEDLKWILTHFKRFNKIAIVTENTVWKWLITFDRVFAKLVGIGEKHFEPSELEEAWDWIKS